MRECINSRQSIKYTKGRFTHNSDVTSVRFIEKKISVDLDGSC